MTNAQRYVERLAVKLSITEGAAREMTAQRAEDARKSAQPVERADALYVASLYSGEYWRDYERYLAEQESQSRGHFADDIA